VRVSSSAQKKIVSPKISLSTITKGNWSKPSNCALWARNVMANSTGQRLAG
jgi:hypothetical protein